MPLPRFPATCRALSLSRKRAPLARGGAVPVLATALAMTGCMEPPDGLAEWDPWSTPETVAERVSDARLVDLTHPLNDETLVWPTSDPFHFQVLFHGRTDDGYYYSARNFSGPEHGGTHLDAPIHFAEGRWTTDQIPLERLMGPAAVVDVSAQAGADPNYQVTVADLEAWEEVHGPIPDGAFLMLFTDRARFWGDPVAYMGTARRGEAGVAELSFPGLHPEAARWLVENRDISAVGLDTPSIDHGPSTLFESHRILFEENMFALENVANLEQLPAIGAVIIALPMLMEGGTGGPIRIVAVVE
jgi:kynurenine formamidase